MSSLKRRLQSTLGSLAGASILGASILALPPALADESPAPKTVKVGTSRGEFELLVFAPERAVAGARDQDLTRPLVLLVSGEGGWRSFDVLLARWFREAGFWVGGIDAMKYFWQAQDDREALAADLRAYADALAGASGRSADSPLLLAGFSFGADLAPRIAGAHGWNGRIRGLVMIAPDEVGSLEFRLSEILGFEPKEHVFKVADALRSAAGVPVLLVHGENDTHSAAPALVSAAAEPKRLVTIAGANHHFSGRETELRSKLEEGLAWLLSPGIPPIHLRPVGAPRPSGSRTERRP